MAFTTIEEQDDSMRFTMALTPIEEQGDSIIRDYCPSYNSNQLHLRCSSYILPPLFNSTFTEERDTVSNEIRKSPKSTPTLKRKGQGLSRCQSGEFCEYTVFALFYELQHTMLDKQFIFIRNFELDNNNPHQIKKTEIEKELPGINLSAVNMDTQIDGIVIVKDLGVVVLEVKNSATEGNILKAQSQLDNGKTFVEVLMGGIQGKTSGKIPCAKVILIPKELIKPSPDHLTLNDYFQIHHDRLEDFRNIWNDIINFLQRSPTSFSSAEFTRFTKICVGIWCMTPIKKEKDFTFDRRRSSGGHQLRKIDEKVSQQVISSEYEKEKIEEKKSDPASYVVYCENNTLFRTCKEVSIVYLTPEQKDIFDHRPHAIIHAGAGSGKTLLTLYKVIDIVQSDKESSKVLLVVPPPHDKRCKEILKKNDIESIIIQKFSADPGAGVFIISLKNFFHVTPQELFEYNTNDFHIFLDDVQSYRAPREDQTIAKYSDILNFLEDTYDKAKLKNNHLWCCVDVLQSTCHYKDDDSSANLFYDNSGQPRRQTIPIVSLTRVLRNSCEIMKVMSDVHNRNKEDRVKENWISKQMSFSYYGQDGEMKPGHSIFSGPVLYQKLRKGSSEDCQIPFVVKMLEEEFAFLFDRDTSLTASNVAILYEKLNGDSLKDAIENFLQQTHNFKTQSIEQSITNNDNDAVVFDSYLNAMSYEVACVIFVCQVSLTVPYYGTFVVASRARARLTFIDYDVTEPEFSFVTKNIILDTWQFKDGTFEKC